MSLPYLDRLYQNFNEQAERRRKALETEQNDPRQGLLFRLEDARLNRNQDCRIIIAGEGGIGKSTFELRAGEISNPEIYVDKVDIAVYQAISFTAKQYMDSVRTIPSASQLSFDEPAQAWYHRQFMSEANIILSKTFIGFRYKKFRTKLTIPNIDLIDVDALRLVNYMVWVSEQGKAEVYRVIVQKFGGDPWFSKIIDEVSFQKPHAKLWHEYEKRKFENQDRLYELYGKQLEEAEAPVLTNREIVDQILKDSERYKMARDPSKFDAKIIQSAFGVGINRGYLLKAMAEGKAKENPV